MSKKIPNKIRQSRDKPETGAFVVAEAFNQACNAKATLSLYRYVYRSRISFAVALSLCLSFFIQGIERAEANTEDSVAVEAVSADTESMTAEENILDISDSNVSIDPVSADDLSQNELTGFVDDEADSVVEDDIDTDTFDSSTDEEDVDLDGIIEDDASDDSLEDVTEDEDNIEISEDIIVNPEQASSSELLGDTVVVVENDSDFSFNKDECTVLASGSFYCAKATERGLKDDLFAAPDSDGDLEIYFTRDGVESQVTSNLVDDAAPFYDKNSDTIVWHRLIDDRYQIVSYDVESGDETVITDTNENNMEPNRQGKYTVWQRWINGGWNIVLHDGEEEKLLTKSTSHNVAPYIHGTLVVWNQHDQVNERTIEMYDIVTETFVTIDDPEGMSVANPRMVFVYDSLHPNGDIVTRGYDVFARKFIDLDTLPRNLPDEIPESDSTGETRALIQNKASGKSEIEDVVDTNATEATLTPEVLDTLDQVGTSSVLVGEAPTLDLRNSEPIYNEESYVKPPEDLVIIGVEEVLVPQEIEAFVEPE